MKSWRPEVAAEIRTIGKGLASTAVSALRGAGVPRGSGAGGDSAPRVTPGPGTRDRAEETATSAGRAEVRGPTKALT